MCQIDWRFGPFCLLVPVLQCAFADVVGVLHRSECSLGSLDTLSSMAVIQYLPDELFGLVNRGADNEAIDRTADWDVGSLICHDRTMTSTHRDRQTPNTRILCERFATMGCDGARSAARSRGGGGRLFKPSRLGQTSLLIGTVGASAVSGRGAWLVRGSDPELARGLNIFSTRSARREVS